MVGAAPERKRAQSALSVALVFAILGALTLTVFATLGWHFSYTHDDPYIHLAVAENILRGQYGVNLDEASAPSSSILFPFLLAPLLALGLGQFGPLFVNAFACAGSVLILGRLIYGKDRVIAPPSWGLAMTAVFVLAAALNLFGLVFTGMEHSLHVLTSLLVLYGLIRTLETGAVPAYLAIALVLNPLVRFEGLALTAGALLVLILAGHWRAAAFAGTAVALLVGGFMAWLVSMGLAPLPSSVLVKSQTLSVTVAHQSARTVAASIYHNAMTGLTYAGGIFILGIGSALALSIVSRLRRRAALPFPNDMLVAISVLPALAGHIFLGRYDWFSRYEIYVVTIAVAAALHVFRSSLRKLFAVNARRRVFAALLGLVAITPFFWRATIFAPSASLGIFLQQYQMHRFATDYYRRPVAVNDLGWVAFENDNYVLDIWGLGSEPARRRRVAARGSGDSRWLAPFADAKDVHLVMIYRSRGERLPPSWSLLGVLEMTVPFTTAAASKVYFFATPGADRPTIDRALAEFATTLPPRATFTRLETLPPER